jgi:hypothetical protein
MTTMLRLVLVLAEEGKWNMKLLSQRLGSLIAM